MIDFLNRENQENMENIADSIRHAIVGKRGVTMQEYEKKAQNVLMSEIGKQNIDFIKNEPALESFFPSSIWAILKERCEKERCQRFYSEKDDEFIRENKEKGTEYLSEYFDVSKDAVRKHAKQIGVQIAKVPQ
jgi:predicted adenine nucleotide alpha hydrolase (AANH) superfamily ATPase